MQSKKVECETALKLAQEKGCAETDPNIETVSHNRLTGEKTMLQVATMPFTLGQIEKAIEEIKKENPVMLMSEPKIMPNPF